MALTIAGERWEITGPTQATTSRGSAKSRILGVLRAFACLHSGLRGIRVCTIPACFLILSRSYAAVYLRVSTGCRSTPSSSPLPLFPPPLCFHPGGRDADISSARRVLAGDKCGINTCWLEAALVQGRGQGVDRPEPGGSREQMGAPAAGGVQPETCLVAQTQPPHGRTQLCPAACPEHWLI